MGKRHQAFVKADQSYGAGYGDAFSDLITAYTRGGGGQAGVGFLSQWILNNVRAEDIDGARELIRNLTYAQNLASVVAETTVRVARIHADHEQSATPLTGSLSRV